MIDDRKSCFLSTNNLKNSNNENIFGLDLRLTSTVKVKWRLSIVTGGGKSQVSLHALFHEKGGTYVVTTTFRRLA